MRPLQTNALLLVLSAALVCGCARRAMPRFIRPETTVSETRLQPFGDKH
jgi:hypothetical protein